MAKKICNQINCHTLIDMKERYCPKHKRDVVSKTNSDYNRYKRNKPHQSFYNSKEWKQARTIAMQRTGGLCEECLTFDLITTADVVDHIIPISASYSRRLEQSNLMPLCHSHHNKKTALENKQIEGAS